MTTYRIQICWDHDNSRTWTHCTNVEQMSNGWVSFLDAQGRHWALHAPVIVVEET
jgi:hypothetical protein